MIIGPGELKLPLVLRLRLGMFTSLLSRTYQTRGTCTSSFRSKVWDRYFQVGNDKNRE